MAGTGYDQRSMIFRVRRRTLLLFKKIWQEYYYKKNNKNHIYIFVAGMQRSGTNMLMEVLERSFHTDVYHETDRRAFDSFQMREEPVIRNLAAASPAPFFIIKALCELDLIPKLMSSFNPAKTVWLLRDVRDVANSAARSFSSLSTSVRQIVKDRNAAEWRGRGMSDDTYERIRTLYYPDMNQYTAAALTWYFRNILFFEKGLDQNNNVLLVCYERLIKDPHLEFERIFKFLGIPYSPWISSIVFANSGRSRIKPLIDTNVEALCDELARRFEDLLRFTTK